MEEEPGGPQSMRCQESDTSEHTDTPSAPGHSTSEPRVSPEVGLCSAWGVALSSKAQVASFLALA